MTTFVFIVYDFNNLMFSKEIILSHFKVGMGKNQNQNKKLNQIKIDFDFDLAYIFHFDFFLD